MNIDVLVNEVIPPSDYQHRNGFNNIHIVDALREDEKQLLEKALIQKLQSEEEREIDTLIVDTLAYLKSFASLPLLNKLLRLCNNVTVKLRIATAIFEISHDIEMIDIALDSVKQMDDESDAYYVYKLSSSFYYLAKFKNEKTEQLIIKYISRPELLIAQNAKRALKIATGFNDLVLDKLEVIFKKSGLQMVEESKNILMFRSVYIDIIIAHNDRENSNNLWLGRAGDSFDKIEINNQVMKEFFNSDIKTSSVPTDIFVNNLVIFFEREGSSLLKGDLNKLIELEKFDHQRNEKYTKKLLGEQHRNAADKAWSEGNYKDFIKWLDKMDKQSLPSSYELKYKMAHQKLKEQ